MGTLYLVSTPIGNLEDITIRATKALTDADMILSEDTRRTGLLLRELKIRRAQHLVRFDEQMEQNGTPQVMEWLDEGKTVALVSDAGTPLISDPGFVLVRQAIKRGIPVVSIPGPSAILAALTSSGLPPQPFMFLGYPPEKQSHRTKLFGNLFQCFKTLEQNPTIIFYCAPHKLIQTLLDMKEVFGDIAIVVARELTKVHEELWRGKISEAITYFQIPKGEFVLLFRIVKSLTP